MKFSFPEKLFEHKAKMPLMVGIGVAIGIVLAMACRSWLDDGPPIPMPEQPGMYDEAPMPPMPAPPAEAIMNRHFEWAEEQETAGLAPRLVPIQEFFAEARQGTRAFAEDALGWDSKWKYVSNVVAGGDEHRKYLEEQFAARIFPPEALEQAVHYSVNAYMKHLDNVDATLLVNLQADLEGIQSGSYSQGFNEAAIQNTLNLALQQAVQAVEGDFPGMVGREIVSYAAGEVLSVAAVQLATSAGILTAAASSGTVTIGAGIVVGMIVDQIVSWAYDEIYDPVGELSKQLDFTLLRLEELILAGDYDHPGLYVCLHDYGMRRGQARNAAISSVVMPVSG